MKHSLAKSGMLEHPPQEAIPIPPQTTGYLWSRTSMLAPVREVVQAVRDWPGVIVAPDSGGLCLALHGVTLGHLRWNGRLDLPFDGEVRDRLIDESMARADPDRPDTGRLVFDVRALGDVDRAVWLLRLAYLSMAPKLRVCATEAVEPCSECE
jgi:hypothetical protein